MLTEEDCKYTNMALSIKLVLLFMSTCTNMFMRAAANSAKTPFTCQAGTFTIGESASVTCHFGRDIYNRIYQWEIVMYPFSAAPGFTGIDIMRCHHQGEKPVCMLKEGFEFDYVVRENMIVTVENVTQGMEGRYACQLIPADGRPKKLCSLTVHARPEAQLCPATNVTLQDQSLETGGPRGRKMFIPSVVLGVALCASIVGNIIFCQLYRLLKNSQNGSDSTIGTSESLLNVKGAGKNGNKKDKEGTKRPKPIEMDQIRIYNEKEDKEHKGDIIIPQPSRWNVVRTLADV